MADLELVVEAEAVVTGRVTYESVLVTGLCVGSVVGLLVGKRDGIGVGLDVVGAAVTITVGTGVGLPSM